ncbi:hypothetical protein BN11_1520002 [Nostocoides australiense Ben110]|uniref:Uncharacterized protein n=1 Tax=Nostocoides australiense Ben110 TaxID=1193182 RepID=W6K1U9_9MICO|nr:hypothetical protein BN11_1520002 [Tetrasphaera australiensis Ben110]
MPVAPCVATEPAEHPAAAIVTRTAVTIRLWDMVLSRSGRGSVAALSDHVMPTSKPRHASLRILPR